MSVAVAGSRGNVEEVTKKENQFSMMVKLLENSKSL